jgi:hypothetical protein
MEAVLRLFAQAGVGVQQRQLDQMSGPERTMAEAIMDHQAEAFAQDPYAAGTALYPNVGCPYRSRISVGISNEVLMYRSGR